MMIDWELTGKIVWCVGIVAWGIIRFRPNIKSRKTTIAVTKRPLKERFSMFISQLGLGIIPAIWVFSGFPQGFDHNVSAPLILVGAMIFIGSLILFRKTHKALGKMWSHSPRSTREPQAGNRRYLQTGSSSDVFSVLVMGAGPTVLARQLDSRICWYSRIWNTVLSAGWCGRTYDAKRVWCGI